MGVTREEVLKFFQDNPRRGLGLKKTGRTPLVG